MGQQGEDIQLSAAARKVFNFAIECKNIAAFVGYTYYEQATTHRQNDDSIPIAVVKGNRKSPLVVISLEDFFKLLKENGNQNNSTT